MRTEIEEEENSKEMAALTMEEQHEMTSSSSDKDVTSSPEKMTISAMEERMESPERATMTLSDGVITQSSGMTSPEKEVTSPEREMPSPEKEMTSPAEEMTSPENEMTSPEKEMMSPEREMTPSIAEDTTKTAEELLIESHFDREFVLVGEDGLRGTAKTVGNETLRSAEAFARLTEKMRLLEGEMHKVMARITTEAVEGDEEVLRTRWRGHTHRRHLLGTLPNVLRQKYDCSVASQAFCKLYEMLVRYPAILHSRRRRIRTLHLCELPGNFIAAVNCFLALYHTRIDWDWTANSLNPHYDFTSAADMLLADDLIVSNDERWLFGPDNSGDVTRLASNLRFFHDEQRADFVTADGSCYAQDQPECQEQVVLPIIVAEAHCALAALRKNGSLVIKTYTTYTEGSLRLYLLLMRVFKRVIVYKPSSSKAGNSERYLIGIDFLAPAWLSRSIKKGLKGVQTLLQALQPTHDECIRLEECAEYFAALQRAAIEANIREFLEPTISKEWLEIARAQCIALYLTAINAKQLAKVQSTGFGLLSVHAPEGMNPWRSQQAANYVEELRLLAQPERATDYLRGKLRARCLRFAGGTKGSQKASGESIDEAPLEVEWSEQETQWISQWTTRRVTHHDGEISVGLGESPVVLVPRASVAGKRIAHSLFVDIRLLRAVQTVAPGSIRDLAEPPEFRVKKKKKKTKKRSTTRRGSKKAPAAGSQLEEEKEEEAEQQEEAEEESDEEWQQWGFVEDDDGVLEVDTEQLRSRRAWLAMLKHVVLEGEQPPKVIRFTIPVPRRRQNGSHAWPPTDSPQVLLLSRFSASLLAFLSVFYFKVEFFHPSRGRIVEFSAPHYPEDLPDDVHDFVKELYETIDNAPLECISFVPPKFFADFHGYITRFNEHQLRAIYERMPV